MPNGRDLRVNLISDVSKFTRGLTGAERDLQSFSGRVGSIATGIGAGLLAGFSVGVIKDQIGQAIKAASNLNESMSKVGVVFGSSSKDIVEWSKTAAKSMLLSQQAALEAAGTFGNLFQSFGLARDKSADMSKTLVQLAADLASFNNTSVDDAIEALRSGVSGEAEPLKRYGVALTDVRLRAEAMAQGIYDGKGALDVAQKAQASYALILKDTALAQGDVKRTATGFANTMRTISASIDDAKAKIGEGIVTAAQDAAKAFGGPGGLSDSIEGAGDALGDFVVGAELGLKQTIGLVQQLNDVLPGPDTANSAAEWAAQFAGPAVKSAFGTILSGFKTASAAGDVYSKVLEQQAVLDDAFGQDQRDIAAQHQAVAAQAYAAAQATEQLGDAGVKAGAAAAAGLKPIEVGAERSISALQRLQGALDGIFSSSGAFGQAQERFSQGIAWQSLLSSGPSKSGSSQSQIPGKKPGTTATVTSQFSTPQDYLDYANSIVSQAVATAKTLKPKRANALLQNAQDKVAQLLAAAGYDNPRKTAAGLIGPVNINPHPRPYENYYRDSTGSKNVDPSRTSTRDRDSAWRADSRTAQRGARTRARS